MSANLASSDLLINLDQDNQSVALEHDLIRADEACRILDVSAATLYAYVSRGLLESRPGPDHRSRCYRREEVERLARSRRAGRGAAGGAAQSLDRGLPVLQTRISLIRADGPYYRGQSAIEAARAGATLEDVARTLWECGADDPFAPEPNGAWPASIATFAGDAALPPLERAMAAIPLLGLEVRHSFSLSPAVRRDIAALLLRQNAALLIGRATAATPVHRQLAEAWRPGDAGLSEFVRSALVLCAEHELNVSAFAARVVASTGAHLHATVCSGLAALSGPRHGGATARAHAVIQAGADAIAERWQRGDDLPGFGHALYPRGDPRSGRIADPAAPAAPRASGNARAGRADQPRRGRQRVASEPGSRAGRAVPSVRPARDVGPRAVRNRSPGRLACACAGTAGAGPLDPPTRVVHRRATRRRSAAALSVAAV